ncbi:MAG: GHMP kinase [archaeon]
MIIRCRAPVRISFGGGGTDVSPYCEDHGGCVINAAINKYAFASLELRKDEKIVLESFDFNEKKEFHSLDELKYDGDLDLLKSAVLHYRKTGINLSLRSDVPPRSGLGSSASAFVAVIGLFNHLKKEHAMTDYEVAELAYTLERKELKNHGGRQDQYATVFGGINFMEFKGDDFVRINPLKVKKDVTFELEKNLVLINLGIRKNSGDIIADQTKRYVEKKDDVVSALNRSKELAIEMNKCLIKGDLNGFGSLMHEAWFEKKKYSNMITNEKIEKMYEEARKAGAIGGKITGAGGGGHMIFYCRPNTEQIVSLTLKRLGAEIVPFSFDFEGMQTWEA